MTPGDWRPTGSLEHLRQRARMLAAIRRFFDESNILEVETPLLCHGIGTDPQLAFFSTEFWFHPNRQMLYLQTSPEFAMKRLLAAGYGSIYQICKAFRNGESGRFHNPEFTLLEWYRVGFDLFQLMAEIDRLIQVVAKPFRTLKQTHTVHYQEIFRNYTGLDPLMFSASVYREFAESAGLPEAVSICENDHALWLDFLFSHCVQPHLGEGLLCMVYGFPACQSSLARLNADNPAITDRVEIFIDGVELGNGFYELCNADEQEARFDKEIEFRSSNGLPPVDKDRRFLRALESGLPDCSGMAIGLDRLLMVMAGAESIEHVLAFPVDRA